MSKHSSLSRVVTLAVVLGLAVTMPLSQAAAAGHRPATTGYRPAIEGRQPAATAGAPASAGEAGGAAAGPAGAGLDWPQFLHDPQHDSVSSATAFTSSNAASATRVWHWQPSAVPGQRGPLLHASPTVMAGVVYTGALSGGFYALKESTGAMLWSRQLDTAPAGPASRAGSPRPRRCGRTRSPAPARSMCPVRATCTR